MTVEDFLDQLREDVYCRLCPSPLGGVGVFAIRDIPDNTNPFNGCDESEYNKIPVEQLTDIHPSVLDLLKDVLVFEDGCFYFSDRGLQGIDLSYYLNHSKTPNMVACPLGETFRTKRFVRAGEELLVDYDTYDSQEGESYR